MREQWGVEGLDARKLYKLNTAKPLERLCVLPRVVPNGSLLTSTKDIKSQQLRPVLKCASQGTAI